MNPESQTSPPAAGVRKSLGITAKSIHAAPDSFAKSRAKQFALQRAAARLLFVEQDGRRQAYRVCHCGRSIQGEGVSIYRHAAGEKARFGGLTTCGSGWTCAVCAANLGTKRRQELSAAMAAWIGTEQDRAAGRQNHVHLVTLTFPHYREDQLADTMERFDKARQGWKNSRSYKRILGKGGAAGCIGAVTSAEITWGENGWHPHLHMLVFTRRSLTAAECEELTTGFRPGERERAVGGWIGQLVKAGLSGNLQDMKAHALDIRDGQKAAEYVAKFGHDEAWGLSAELTKSHAKEARMGGLSPFGLLRAYYEGDAQAGARFVEFAGVFLGRRLVTWAPGLEKALGIDRDDCDETAAEEQGAEEYCGRLTPEQWGTVLRADARADLLEYARTCLTNPDEAQQDLDDYVRYLADLTAGGRPPSRGWFYQPMAPRPKWMN